jgi:hypothetical protein
MIKFVMGVTIGGVAALDNRAEAATVGLGEVEIRDISGVKM